MKTMFLGATIVALLCLVAPSTTFAGSCSSDHANTSASAGVDLVDTAVAAGSFETLVAAVEAAGLVDVLKGDGPFTVFAPTDDAFAALPAGTVESLLEPESRDRLVEILKYHVVSGRVLAVQALAAGSAPTLQGDAVEIGLRDGVARVEQARLVQTDVEATNGVIHVIDRVLLPEPTARTSRGATRLIERAIDRGVPLFNGGNAAACAAVYRTAADGLLAVVDVPAASKEALERALRRADRTHDARDQAWILRDALDAVYDDLRSTDMARR